VFVRSRKSEAKSKKPKEIIIKIASSGSDSLSNVEQD